MTENPQTGHRKYTTNNTIRQDTEMHDKFTTWIDKYFFIDDKHEMLETY